jgi:hypothetical protein
MTEEQKRIIRYRLQQRVGEMYNLSEKFIDEIASLVTKEIQ